MPAASSSSSPQLALASKQPSVSTAGNRKHCEPMAAPMRYFAATGVLLGRSHFAGKAVGFQAKWMRRS